jgi:hypothetical protein
MGRGIPIDFIVAAEFFKKAPSLAVVSSVTKASKKILIGLFPIIKDRQSRVTPMECTTFGAVWSLAK